MAVLRRGNKWQADFTYRGQRYRKGAFDTKEEAEEWMAEAKEAATTGRNPKESGRGRPATMEALKNLTYRRFWSGTKGERTTLLNAEQVVAELGPTTKPCHVNEAMIDDMIFAFEKKGNSDATINRKLAALSKMLTFAERRGYIKRRPLIERRKESQGRIRWYTQEEERAIVNAARHFGHDDYADLILFLVDTGARTGEAWRLQWRDVRSDGVLFSGRKGGTETVVPLTGRARRSVEKQRQRVSDTTPTGLVWEGMNNNTLPNVWSRIRKHLNQQSDTQFVPHALRHTFCSRLVQAGVPIQTVKELAGHKTIQVTLRYAHLAPKNLTSAVATLEAIGYHPQNLSPEHSGDRLVTQCQSPQQVA